MELKIRRALLEQELVQYASDHIDMPADGIDCGEGCNPYGFPPELRDAAERFDMRRLGPYPHSNAIFDGLTEYWKGHFFLEPENLMITDGSIAAIYNVLGLFGAGAKILGVTPQFTDFALYAKMNDMDYSAIPLRRENQYRIEPDEIMDAIDESLSAVYLDNPNNPTGQIIDAYAVEKILQKAETCGVAVIVDEAYGDFMPNENSAARYLERYHNMIMLRTLSKAFGLAGLRIGYVIAAKPVIACLRKLSNPYQVSEFAREMGGEALRHSYHIWDNIVDFARQKREIRAGIGHRLHMAATCDTVSLCLLYHENPAVDLKKEFYERGVLTVSGRDFYGLDASFARVRLPKMEDFPRLLAAIKEIDQAQ